MSAAHLSIVTSATVVSSSQPVTQSKTGRFIAFISRMFSSTSSAPTNPPRQLAGRVVAKKPALTERQLHQLAGLCKELADRRNRYSLAATSKRRSAQIERILSKSESNLINIKRWLQHPQMHSDSEGDAATKILTAQQKSFYSKMNEFDDEIGRFESRERIVVSAPKMSQEEIDRRKEMAKLGGQRSEILAGVEQEGL